MKYPRRLIEQLHRDNKRFPKNLTVITEWPPGVPRDSRVVVMRSRDFLVQVFDEGNNLIRLSICQTDWDVNAGRWKDGITWDDLQRIKSEAGYGDRQAVEIFPENSNVVNVANMLHLWVLPEALPFAWSKESRHGQA